MSVLLQDWETERARTAPAAHAGVPLTAHDSARLSAEVGSELRTLHEFLRGLDSRTLNKIPRDTSCAPEFGRQVAAMIVTLGFLNDGLIHRLFSDVGKPTNLDPRRLSDFLRSTALPKRRPRADVVERKLRALLHRLNQLIGYLDEESFMRLPVDLGDAPEFLAYSTTIQSNLAWYLDVHWFPRMFVFEVPAAK